MTKLKKNYIKITLQYILLFIGCILAAYSLEAILIPNSILDGGVTGISIILNLLLGWKLSILIILINIPFLYIGYKNLGKTFLIKTITSIATFSIFLELFHNITPLTDNTLLATIYGSIFLGIGVGLVILNGGCLDGTESLGIVISKNTSLSVGNVVLICNCIIFSIAGIFFGIDRALYSLLAYFITSKIVDEVSEGLNKGKAVMIITNDAKSIKENIYKKIGRTTTTIKGKGLISGEKEILYCIITRLEIPELKRIVTEQDESAFITITDVSEIIGTHIKSNKKILEEE